MTYITESRSAIATTRDRICADQLAEGDTIVYKSSRILVITEPEYRYSGIVLDALWLDVASPDNTQQLTFEPNTQFELVSHAAPVSTQIAA